MHLVPCSDLRPEDVVRAKRSTGGDEHLRGMSLRHEASAFIAFAESVKIKHRLAERE